MARRLRPPSKKPVTASKPIEAAELLGLSREELAALGDERFETLLSEAFQRELERRMRGVNAAMETAKALIPQGQVDTALGLLQSAANALGQDALSHRDISRRFARMIFGSRSERLEREQLGLAEQVQPRPTHHQRAKAMAVPRHDNAPATSPRVILRGEIAEAPGSCC